jgi:hypothetical protein
VGRIEFLAWDEFVSYVKKIGHDRVMIFITENQDLIMRPAVQSRIDSAYFEHATDDQIKSLEKLVNKTNVFTVGSFDWMEDRQK